MRCECASPRRVMGVFRCGWLDLGRKLGELMLTVVWEDVKGSARMVRIIFTFQSLKSFYFPFHNSKSNHPSPPSILINTKHQSTTKHAPLNLTLLINKPFSPTQTIRLTNHSAFPHPFDHTTPPMNHIPVPMEFQSILLRHSCILIHRPAVEFHPKYKVCTCDVRQSNSRFGPDLFVQHHIGWSWPLDER